MYYGNTFRTMVGTYKKISKKRPAHLNSVLFTFAMLAVCFYFLFSIPLKWVSALLSFVWSGNARLSYSVFTHLFAVGTQNLFP